MAKLYKWKVASAPTGRFRSFQHRSWPIAIYAASDKTAAQIICGNGELHDSYSPTKARSGDHAELKVMVADHSQPKWQWRTLKQRFATLDAAKAGFDTFIAGRPDFAPKDE
jgi:hypothetical protein